MRKPLRIAKVSPSESIFQMNVILSLTASRWEQLDSVIQRRAKSELCVWMCVCLFVYLFGTDAIVFMFLASAVRLGEGRDTPAPCTAEFPGGHTAVGTNGEWPPFGRFFFFLTKCIGADGG